eukprot:jgi/Antlo1/800/208
MHMYTTLDAHTDVCVARRMLPAGSFLKVYRALALLHRNVKTSARTCRRKHFCRTDMGFCSNCLLIKLCFG